MPELTERSNAKQTETLQKLIAEMQTNFQQQLQQQQQEFQIRIESLLIGKGKGTDNAVPAVDKASASSPQVEDNQLPDNNDFQQDEANIGIAINDVPEPSPRVPRFPQVHHSQYVREPSYPRSYTQNLKRNSEPSTRQEMSAVRFYPSKF